MPKLNLEASDQLNRTDRLIREVEHLQDAPSSWLATKPEPKAWSVQEVIDHLNQAYAHYRPQFDATLANLPNSPESHGDFVSRWLPSQFIRMMRPKGRKRKWKMRTMKMLEPQPMEAGPTEEIQDEIFYTFYDNHYHLKEAIAHARHKEVRSLQVNSALGSLVRFYLPEAFEFLLSHAERHLVQAKETLDRVSPPK